jgi:hypothetical protein
MIVLRAALAPAVLSLSLAACAPRVATTEVIGPLIVASEATGEGMRGVAYRPRADGALDVVAKAEIAGGRLRFAQRGFEGVSTPADALAGSRAPFLLNLILFVAWSTLENDCAEMQGREPCLPMWDTWANAPESATFAFEAIDVVGATRLLPEVGDLQSVSSTEKRVTSCRAFPNYYGDQVCTGWTGRVFGAAGARDSLPCCSAHDACYFDCPLEGESCNGTACIAGCNDRIAGCCTDRGGDPATCATYKLATDVAGGRGANGCGRAKAEQFCADLDVRSDGCGVERCVCDECHALFPDGPDCAACDCVSDCLPIDPEICFRDGISHGVRTCRFVDYGGVGCFKWSDARCAVGEACSPDASGNPTCGSALCPSADECSDVGAVEQACFAHASGAYFRVCTIDTDGCLVWERSYCDVEGQGVGTCVVTEDGPVCLGT